MKVFEQVEAWGKQGKNFVLMLDTEEARTLVEIATAAADSNKRKSTFRAWAKKLEELLHCF
jgi:hypothetical protein